MGPSQPRYQSLLFSRPSGAREEGGKIRDPGNEIGPILVVFQVEHIFRGRMRNIQQSIKFIIQIQYLFLFYFCIVPLENKIFNYNSWCCGLFSLLCKTSSNLSCIKSLTASSSCSEYLLRKLWKSSRVLSSLKRNSSTNGGCCPIDCKRAVTP